MVWNFDNCDQLTRTEGNQTIHFLINCWHLISQVFFLTYINSLLCCSFIPDSPDMDLSISHVFLPWEVHSRNSIVRETCEWLKIFLSGMRNTYCFIKTVSSRSHELQYPLHYYACPRNNLCHSVAPLYETEGLTSCLMPWSCLFWSPIQTDLPCQFTKTQPISFNTQPVSHYINFTNFKEVPLLMTTNYDSKISYCLSNIRNFPLCFAITLTKSLLRAQRKLRMTYWHLNNSLDFKPINSLVGTLRTQAPPVVFHLELIQFNTTGHL